MSDLDLPALQQRLTGTRLAGPFTHLATTGSTNSLALEAAQAGALTGIWVADEQTAGRGRGGHHWHSAPGDGLYLSVLVRPELPVDRALWISLSTGLAARAAISSATGLAIDIRWPNDLLLNGRKCGGILVETAVATAPASTTPSLRYAVIGIGINLNHTEFPPELNHLATSLRIASGSPVLRQAVLCELLVALDREIDRLTREPARQGDGPALLQRFTAASAWVLGKRVRVEEGGGYTGVTAGLDHRGFLLVAGDDGVMHTVLSGGVREP